MISSTATTVSYARRTALAPGSSGIAAIVVIIASTVVFVRVLLEIALVAPRFLPVALPPFSVILALQGLVAVGMWLRNRNRQNEMPEHGNPSELKSALWFGLLYAVVVFAIAAAKQHFGERGLYFVAGLSGLTDMDAITLSTSQLVNTGRLDPSHGWKLILIASMSNLVFKAAIVAVLDRGLLLKAIIVPFCLTLAAGAFLLSLWPG